MRRRPSWLRHADVWLRRADEPRDVQRPRDQRQGPPSRLQTMRMAWQLLPEGFGSGWEEPGARSSQPDAATPFSRIPTNDVTSTLIAGLAWPTATLAPVLPLSRTVPGRGN